MNALHYIIFHPDYAREKIEVKAKILLYNKVKDWQGSIWVDETKGNEDPYVFHTNWLYSYCHATQIKRQPNENEPFVKEDSFLFFCNGDSVDNDYLQFDTVFKIDRITHWYDDGMKIPKEFESHYKNNKSELWRRHFRFPSVGIHKGKYTYVGKIWDGIDNSYSFLPISMENERVLFHIEELPEDLRNKIIEKRKGKYPISLIDEEKEIILDLIERRCFIKVIKDIVKLNSL